MKEISADIVVSTFTHDVTFLPSIKDGSKKVLEFHFSKGYKLQRSITENWSFIFRLAYGFRSFWEEYTIPKKYDAFVVLTNEDKTAWDTVRPDTIVIPNIIPLLSTEVSSKNNKLVIAVGRLDNQKGFDRLIDLWDLIKGTSRLVAPYFRNRGRQRKVRVTNRKKATTRSDKDFSSGEEHRTKIFGIINIRYDVPI